jgi:hypothetical protein
MHSSAKPLKQGVCKASSSGWIKYPISVRTVANQYREQSAQNKLLDSGRQRTFFVIIGNKGVRAECGDYTDFKAEKGTAPSRINKRSGPVTSIMVDGGQFAANSPPSTIKSSPSPKYSRIMTALAAAGLPEMLALVDVIGTPAALASFNANDSPGIRTATFPSAVMNELRPF